MSIFRPSSFLPTRYGGTGRRKSQSLTQRMSSKTNGQRQSGSIRSFFRARARSLLYCALASSYHDMIRSLITHSPYRKCSLSLSRARFNLLTRRYKYTASTWSFVQSRRQPGAGRRRCFLLLNVHPACRGVSRSAIVSFFFLFFPSSVSTRDLGCVRYQPHGHLRRNPRRP